MGEKEDERETRVNREGRKRERVYGEIIGGNLKGRRGTNNV